MGNKCCIFSQRCQQETNHVVTINEGKNYDSGISNRIKTTKYSLLTFLPKNLFEQFKRFANIYFLFIVILNWIPQINAFGKEIAMLPLLFVLSITALKDGYEDYKRYKNDKKVNNRRCQIYNK